MIDDTRGLLKATECAGWFEHRRTAFTSAPLFAEFYTPSSETGSMHRVPDTRTRRRRHRCKAVAPSFPVASGELTRERATQRMRTNASLSQESIDFRGREPREINCAECFRPIPSGRFCEPCERALEKRRANR
jgi:hypothetical protein